MQKQRKRLSLKNVGAIVAFCCLIALLVGIVLSVRQGIQIARSGPPCQTPGPDRPATMHLQSAPGQSGLYVSNDAGLSRLSIQQNQLIPAWIYKMHNCLILPSTQVAGVAFPTYPSPYIVGATAIADNMAYLLVQNQNTQQTSLYALSAPNGQMVWQTQIPAGEQAFGDIDMEGSLTLQVVRNMVYVDTALDSGVSLIIALNASNGSIRWKAQYPISTEVASSPREGLNDVSSQMVYLAQTAQSEPLIALNASTGTQVWDKHLPDTLQVNGARLFDGTLYVSANTACSNCENPSGALFAFNATTGTQLWQSRMFNGYLSLPSAANGIVYVGSTDGTLHALSANRGSQLWQRNLHAEVLYQPVISNDLVCVRTNLLPSDDSNTVHTHLICLNAANGNQVWSYTFPLLATPLNQYNNSAPLFTAHGLLYAGTTALDTYTIDILQAASGKLVGTYSTTISGNQYNLVQAL